MRAALDGHALVIGIDDYRGGITPLQSAANDAAAVSAMLSADHGYRSRCFINADASSAAILQALADARDLLEEDSGFLLYFAGHGVALGEGEQGPQGFLLAQDALPTDERSWLSMDALRQALEQLPCRHVLVVLDCCFAGSFRWSSSRDAALLTHPLYDSQLARFLDGQAWLALTSASHDQRAADTLPGRRNTRDSDSSSTHSPFALAFMRGLSGSADSSRAQREPDGVITATELYQFLYDELMPVGVSSRQTPGLWPLRPCNVGEFVFLNPSAALNTRPDPPLDDQNNPWLGLRAYEASDAGLFFGRRRVVTSLIERASDPLASLLVVVGASGTGKSSVVKAGLLPSLLAAAPAQDATESDPARGWQVVHVARLRAEPTLQLNQAKAELAAAGRNQRQLLLIDQFEELYTQCRDTALRAHFLLALRALVDQPGGPLVVLTLRSDFEPRLASCEQFSQLLPTARFLVPTFSTEELREIVEAPLAAKALYFDPPELVDRLLDEVAAMPGALPLLSFALAEMYRHAQRRRRQTGSADRALNQDDYLATGGVVGALHRRASSLYLDGDSGQQRTVRRVFLRMVLQEGARTTRRRVNLLELAYPDPAEQTRINQVLDDYVGARLLVIDQQYVEPAHDTLVVAWDLLLEWLAGSPEHPLMRALWRAARDWDNASRPAGLLWNADPRLPQALALKAELNTLEWRFIRSSLRRKRHRRWTLEAIGALVMLALAVAALYSMERADEAIRQTRIAERQLDKAQWSAGRANLALATSSIANADPFAALMSAGEAIGYRQFGIREQDFDPEARSTLRAPLLHRTDSLYLRAITLLTQAHLTAPRAVAWRALHRVAASADGRIIAGGDGLGAIEVRDFASAEMVLLDRPAGDLSTLAVSSDGRSIAAVVSAPDGSRELALWRSAGDWQQVERERLDLPLDAEIFDLFFSPAGDRLAAAMATDIVLWHLPPTAPPSVQWLALGTGQGISRRSSLAFSADGSALLSGGWHNRLTRYPLPGPNRERLAAAEVEPIRVRGTALGPEWSLWSENTEKGDFVNAIEVSAHGDYVVLASANEILVGEVKGESLDFSANRVHRSITQIFSLALSAEGDLLAYGDGDGVRILRFPSLEPVALQAPLTFRPGQVGSLAFFSRGRMLLVGGPGRMELVDVSALVSESPGAGAASESDIPALETLPPAGQQEALRALIEDGRLDPLALAFPDVDFPPGGMRWEIVEDYGGDGIDVLLSQQQDAASDPVERGSLQLRLSPGTPQQVAVGISQLDGLQLRGGMWGTVDLFTVDEQALVFRQILEGELWSLNRMRYSDDGERLLISTSDQGGGIQRLRAFPTAQPDLTVYLSPVDCQPPVNLPPGHWLRTTRLLDCQPSSAPDHPSTAESIDSAAADPQ